MKQPTKERRELKAIGKVLSRRLVESSNDSITKVAAAEENGVARVAGMHPRK